MLDASILISNFNYQVSNGDKYCYHEKLCDDGVLCIANNITQNETKSKLVDFDTYIAIHNKVAHEIWDNF